MNHESFENRLTQVKNVLEGFRLEAISITPVEYEADCPFPYNNFLYEISLKEPITSTSFPPQIASTALSGNAQVTKLIMRLSNIKAEGLNQANRVQNEVAAIHIARNSLSSAGTDAVIPAVYAWSPPKNGDLGWILMEQRKGEPLDRHFPSMPADEKSNVLDQLAAIFAAIQKGPVPAGVHSHGGLTITEDGEIESGEMTTLMGGPWDTYTAFLRTQLERKLMSAEGNGCPLKGWQPNGVRARIDTLLITVFDSQSQWLTDAGIDTSLRSLVHGDFTTNNVLFDPPTSRVTGLVDFDFALVSHPAQEFFTSFHDLGGQLGGNDDTIRDAMLSGIFEASMVTVAQEQSWQMAKEWDEALKRHGAYSPSEISGMTKLAGLELLAELLSPFRLVHPMFLARKTANELAANRVEAENRLKRCLESLGF